MLDLKSFNQDLITSISKILPHHLLSTTHSLFSETSFDGCHCLPSQSSVISTLLKGSGHVWLFPGLTPFNTEHPNPSPNKRNPKASIIPEGLQKFGPCLIQRVMFSKRCVGSTDVATNKGWTWSLFSPPS